MVDIQTVSIAIASAGVLIGVVYYFLDIRHQARVRQTELIMQLYSEWKGKELADAYMKVVNLEFKDYDDFIRKYGPWYSESEVYTAFRMVCMMFEEMGVLLYRGLLDINIVVDLFSITTKTTWEKVRLLVEANRKRNPNMLVYFEYLYNEMTKREQKLQQSTAKGE
jgi:hypothetical protein